MEFAVDRAQVHVDGVLRDREFVGDFLFDESAHEVVEDIFFARGERVDRLDRTVARKPVEDHFGDGAAERRGAIDDIADALDDVVGVGGFEKVAGGSVADGAVDFVAIVGGGEHEDFRVRHDLADVGQDIESAATREPEVEQKEIGEIARELEFLKEVGGRVELLAAFHVGLRFDEAADLFREDLMVVDDPDFRGLGGGVGFGGICGCNHMAGCVVRCECLTKSWMRVPSSWFEAMRSKP